MLSSGYRQKSYSYRISGYIKSHWASLGLFLTAYGAFYLSSVILNRRITVDWEKTVTIYAPTSINPLIPRIFMDPLFFITSFPALSIGAAMLCAYSLRGIHPDAPADKQYVAILLTILGFTYIVIGAWPLQNSANFPWQWQKQIVSFGPVFAWALYITSLIVLFIGSVSLYKHSVFHNQRQSSEEMEKW